MTCPRVFSVTGGTGSGKTFVCKLILEQLAGSGLDTKRVQIISQDSFYRDLPQGAYPSSLLLPCWSQKRGALVSSADYSAVDTNIAEYNFDHPRAFDEDIMVEALTKLKEKQPVELSVYDSRTFAR